MAELRIYRDHLTAVQSAIDALRKGQASAAVYGTTYTAGDVDGTLLPLMDRLSVLAAIESIEQGNQAFSVGSRTYTKADLKELYARRDTIERRTATASRGGARARTVVPI